MGLLDDLDLGREAYSKKRPLKLEGFERPVPKPEPTQRPANWTPELAMEEVRSKRSTSGQTPAWDPPAEEPSLQETDPNLAQAYKDINTFKKDISALSSDVSNYKEIAGTKTNALNDFYENTVAPFWQEQFSEGFLETPELDLKKPESIDGFFKDIDSRYDGFQKRVDEGDTSWFGEDEQLGRASRMLKGKRKYDLIKQKHARMLKDYHQSQNAFNSAEARKKAMKEALMSLPENARRAAGTWKEENPDKTLTPSQINSLLDKQKFEKPQYSLTGDLINPDKVDPRLNLDEGDYYSKKDQDRQGKRLGAVEKYGLSGLQKDLKELDTATKLKKHGMMYSVLGEIANRSIYISAAEKEAINLDRIKKAGFGSYKGTDINEAIENLGGEDRIIAASLVENVGKAHVALERAKVFHAANVKQKGAEEAKREIELAEKNFSAAFNAAIQGGFGEEIEKRGRSNSWYGNLYNAYRAGDLLEDASDFTLKLAGYSEFTQTDAKKLIDIMTEMQNLETSETYKSYKQSSSDNLLDAFGNIFKHGLAIPEMVTETLTGFFNTYFTEAPRTLAITTGTGALAGTVITPGAGTLAGAGTGAAWGLRLNAGVSSFVMEYVGEFLSEMEKAGVDWHNPNVFMAAFNNPTLMAEVREKATKKAGGVAFFDIIAAGIAGKTMRLVKNPSSLKKLPNGVKAFRQELDAGIQVSSARQSLAMGAELAVQGGLGGTGEAVGQLLTLDPGEEIDWDAIAAEMGIEALGPGGWGFATNYALSKFRGGYALEDLTGTEANILNKEQTADGYVEQVDQAGFRYERRRFNTAQDYLNYVVEQTGMDLNSPTGFLVSKLVGFAQASGKIGNLGVVVADRTPFSGSTTRGAYNNGTIFLNKKALAGREDSTPFVLLHEGGHYIQDMFFTPEMVSDMYGKYHGDDDAKKLSWAQYKLGRQVLSLEDLSTSELNTVNSTFDTTSDLVKHAEWFTSQVGAALAIESGLAGGTKVDSNVKKAVRAMMKYITGDESVEQFFPPSPESDADGAVRLALLAQLGFDPNTLQNNRAAFVAEDGSQAAGTTVNPFEVNLANMANWDQNTRDVWARILGYKNWKSLPNKFKRGGAVRRDKTLAGGGDPTATVDLSDPEVQQKLYKGSNISKPVATETQEGGGNLKKVTTLSPEKSKTGGKVGAAARTALSKGAAETDVEELGSKTIKTSAGEPLNIIKKAGDGGPIDLKGVPKERSRVESRIKEIKDTIAELKTPNKVWDSSEKTGPRWVEQPRFETAEDQKKAIAPLENELKGLEARSKNIKEVPVSKGGKPIPEGLGTGPKDEFSIAKQKVDNIIEKAGEATKPKPAKVEVVKPKPVPTKNKSGKPNIARDPIAKKDNLDEVKPTVSKQEKEADKPKEVAKSKVTPKKLFEDPKPIKESTLKKLEAKSEKRKEQAVESKKDRDAPDSVKDVQDSISELSRLNNKEMAGRISKAKKSIIKRKTEQIQSLTKDDLMNMKINGKSRKLSEVKRSLLKKVSVDPLDILRELLFPGLDPDSNIFEALGFSEFEDIFDGLEAKTLTPDQIKKLNSKIENYFDNNLPELSEQAPVVEGVLVPYGVHDVSIPGAAALNGKTEKSVQISFTNNLGEEGDIINVKGKRQKEGGIWYGDKEFTPVKGRYGWEILGKKELLKDGKVYAYKYSLKAVTEDQARRDLPWHEVPASAIPGRLNDFSVADNRGGKVSRENFRDPLSPITRQYLSIGQALRGKSKTALTAMSGDWNNKAKEGIPARNAYRLFRAMSKGDVDYGLLETLYGKDTDTSKVSYDDARMIGTMVLGALAPARTTSKRRVASMQKNLKSNFDPVEEKLEKENKASGGRAESYEQTTFKIDEEGNTINFLRGLYSRIRADEKSRQKSKDDLRAADLVLIDLMNAEDQFGMTKDQIRTELTTLFTDPNNEFFGLVDVFRAGIDVQSGDATKVAKRFEDGRPVITPTEDQAKALDKDFAEIEGLGKSMSPDVVGTENEGGSGKSTISSKSVRKEKFTPDEFTVEDSDLATPKPEEGTWQDLFINGIGMEASYDWVKLIAEKLKERGLIPKDTVIVSHPEIRELDASLSRVEADQRHANRTILTPRVLANIIEKNGIDNLISLPDTNKQGRVTEGGPGSGMLFYSSILSKMVSEYGKITKGKKGVVDAGITPAELYKRAIELFGEYRDGGARWAKKHDNGFEVSSKAPTKLGKSFSAFNAKLSDGKSIEHHYQVNVKGHASIKEGKGKPPKDTSIDSFAEYKKLWEQYAEENPKKIEALRKAAEGKVLTDMFATTDVNQARALVDIIKPSRELTDKEWFKFVELFGGPEDTTIDKDSRYTQQKRNAEKQFAFAYFAQFIRKRVAEMGGMEEKFGDKIATEGASENVVESKPGVEDLDSPESRSVEDLGPAAEVENVSTEEADGEFMSQIESNELADAMMDPLTKGSTKKNWKKAGVISNLGPLYKNIRKYLDMSDADMAKDKNLASLLKKDKFQSGLLKNKFHKGTFTPKQVRDMAKSILSPDQVNNAESDGEAAAKLQALIDSRKEGVEDKAKSAKENKAKREKAKAQEKNEALDPKYGDDRSITLGSEITLVSEMPALLSERMAASFLASAKGGFNLLPEEMRYKIRVTIFNQHATLEDIAVKLQKDLNLKYGTEARDFFDMMGVVLPTYAKVKIASREFNSRFREPIVEALKKYGVTDRVFGKYVQALAAGTFNRHVRGLLMEAQSDVMSSIADRQKKINDHESSLGAESITDTTKKELKESISKYKSEIKQLEKDFESYSFTNYHNKDGEFAPSGFSDREAALLVESSKKDPQMMKLLKDKNDIMGLWAKMNATTIKVALETGQIKQDEAFKLITAKSRANSAEGLVDVVFNALGLDKKDDQYKENAKIIRKTFNSESFKYQRNEEKGSMPEGYHYSPMQGFEDNEFHYEEQESLEQLVTGKSGGSSGWQSKRNNDVGKRVMGRRTGVDKPNPESALAHAFLAHDAMVMRGAKIAPGQRIREWYELFLEMHKNKDNLGEKIEWSERFSEVAKNNGIEGLMNDKRKRQIVFNEFNEFFDVLEEHEDGKMPTQTGLKLKTKVVNGKERIVIRKGEIPINIANDPSLFLVKNGGELQFVKFKLKDGKKGDGKTLTSRGARLTSELSNLNYQPSNPLFRAIQIPTRFLAQMYTSFNPDFLLSNAVKDAITGMINVTEDEKKTIFKDLINPKNYGRAVKAIYKVEREMEQGPRSAKYKNMPLEEALKIGDNDWEGWFRFFEANGMRTAFTSQDEVTQYMEAVKEDIGILSKRGKFSKAKMKLLESNIVKTVEAMNAGVENAMRLLVAKHLLKKGFTVQQAVMAGRNISVDFNRKGTLSSGIGSLFLFFNAGVQGNLRMIKSMVGRDRVAAAKLITGIMAFSFTWGLLQRMLTQHDEDEDGENEGNHYDRLGDFERDTNLTMFFPGTDYNVRIPLPWGYNLFWMMGQKAANVAAQSMGSSMGGSGIISNGTNAMSNIYSTFNPLGGTLMPGFIAPLYQVAQNETFYGAPITKPNRQFEETPAAFRSSKNTKEFFVDFSKKMNGWLGGDEITPGSMKRMFGSDEVVNPMEDWSWALSGSDLEHIFEGYTGGPGATFSRLVSGAYSGINGNLDMNWAEVPVSRRFFREGYSSYMTSKRFYNLKKRTDNANEYVKNLKSGKNIKESKEAISGNRDLLQIKPMVDAADTKRKAIQRLVDKVNASQLSESQKLDKVEKLEKQRVAAWLKVLYKARKMGIDV